MGVSPVGSPSVTQVTSDPRDTVFSEELAAAQLGVVGAGTTNPTNAGGTNVATQFQTPSKVILHMKFSQMLADAMTKVAEARTEAQTSDD